MFPTKKFAALTLFILSTPLFSQDDLPYIYARAEDNEKYMDWGTKPNEPEQPNYWVGCEACDFFIPGKASSTMNSGGGYNYSLGNLSDDDPGTAWVEGKSDDGIGEYFEVSGIIYANGIMVLNGLQKSKALFDANSRVKTFKIYINNVPNCMVELQDKMGKQFFNPIGFENGAPDLVTIKFEIMEVYPGKKYKDTCISELVSVGG